MQTYNIKVVRSLGQAGVRVESRKNYTFSIQFGARLRPLDLHPSLRLASRSLLLAQESLGSKSGTKSYERRPRS